MIEIEELGNNLFVGILKGVTYKCYAPNFKTARLRIMKHFGLKP